MFKYFDPFTEQWLHNRAKDQLLSPALDWHFPGNGGLDGDISKSCFMRLAYDAERSYVNWDGLNSLVYVLDCWIENNSSWFKFNGLNRCIANFYAPGQVIGWHTDHSKNNYYTLIYYVNDADGGTEVGDQQILHKENAGIILKSNVSHNPIVSKVPRRISVAWILDGEIRD